MLLRIVVVTFSTLLATGAVAGQLTEGSKVRVRIAGELADDGSVISNVVGAALEIRSVKTLLDLRPRVDERRYYAPSIDGERFLVNSLDSDVAAAPVTLLVNWPAVIRP